MVGAGVRDRCGRGDGRFVLVLPLVRVHVLVHVHDHGLVAVQIRGGGRGRSARVSAPTADQVQTCCPVPPVVLIEIVRKIHC